MPYTLQASCNSGVNVTETPDSATSPGSSTVGASRLYDNYQKSASLNATSKPPISGQVIDISATLAAVDEDIDLLAAPWAGDLSKPYSATGLKLVAIEFFCPAANVGPITLKPHPATTPYHLFGNATNMLALQKGTKGCIYLDAEGLSSYVNPNQAVGAVNKVIRRSGTIGDKLSCKLVFGA